MQVCKVFPCRWRDRRDDDMMRELVGVAGKWMCGVEDEESWGGSFILD